MKDYPGWLFGICLWLIVGSILATGLALTSIQKDIHAYVACYEASAGGKPR